MKKNEYLAPEMEIVEITVENSILAGSPIGGENPGGNLGGGGDAPEY